jgi:Sulfite oxidase and related enzymes
VHGGLPAPGKLPALAAQKNTALSTTQATTPYKDVTTYNNFYEFGTSKSDPSQNAGSLKTRPWTVVVEGEVHKPRTFGIDDLLKLAPMEERIYRHRCVEGWAMVVPWLGYSLSNLLKAVEPTGNAKYVEYITLLDPAEMPGQNDPILQWPYLEGLRMDEAMHPLTCSRLACMAKCCPIRTVRRCAWSFPGNTGSRAASPSSRSGWWKNSPSLRGCEPCRSGTGSTPTSTPT